MFTAGQLIAHLVGDYIIQSHWMATQKTKNSLAAAIHAVTYALPFLFLTQSLAALAVIIGTHFLIDRYRLARYVVWAKNGPVRVEFYASSVRSSLRLGLWRLRLKPVTATGFPEGTPDWLAVWLLIIVDNILHILINGLALAHL